MQQLGIRFDPPSLVLVYQYNEQKIHQRVMPIRNFNLGSNVSFLASQLKLRHEEFLTSVPPIRIEKMLRILQVSVCSNHNNAHSHLCISKNLFIFNRNI